MAEMANAWGLEYSATNDAGVAHFEAAVTSYLAARADTMALVQAILDQHPDMVMAVCLRGYLLRLAAHPQFHTPLRQAIAQAQTLVGQGQANQRERLHVEALASWADDRGDAALTCLEGLLQEFPLDMLALRIAHYLHFYTGIGEKMRDSTGRVVAVWPEEHPHYHYLLGMHAFGLEEAGEYEAALEYGQHAVAANNADIWATHAVSHVHQMLGQHQAGLEWLDGLRDQWQGTNNFRNHVIWHGALHHLGLGNPEDALRIYDAELAQSTADDFYLDMCNNAALLWRLQFLGLDVGDRWQQLADLCAAHAQDQELVFASLHYLMPLAVTGAAETQTVLAALHQWSQRGGEQGGVCGTVGLNLAKAIVASVDAPEVAAEVLIDSQAHTYLIGGSKAQRDLFRLLAEDDASRAGRTDLVGAWG
jgi:tetratricopeptide (TPR) repeat protein